jgi:hypothetical protein
VTAQAGSREAAVAAMVESVSAEAPSSGLFSTTVTIYGQQVVVEGSVVDAVCLGKTISDEIATSFSLPVLPVNWHRTAPGEAVQIVAPTLGEAWFDHDELAQRVAARHGATGARCPACGTWRWYPLPPQELPPLRVALPRDVDVAASPEWFGAGCRAFRELAFRRQLAEMIATASPRDFEVRELPIKLF